MVQLLYFRDGERADLRLRVLFKLRSGGSYNSVAINICCRPFRTSRTCDFLRALCDRIGRKKMLIASLLPMGVPTTLIGKLPTFIQIGIMVPIALTLIRDFQGIALGGEWGGGVPTAVEHAPEKRSGFFGSLAQIGCPAALVLSSGTFALRGLLAPDDFQAWGWRLPFLASGMLIAIGFFIRGRGNESPVFERVENSRKVVNIPFVEIDRKHMFSVTVGVGAKRGEITMFWLFAVIVLSFSTCKLGLPRPVILQATTLGATAVLLLMPIFGLLSDRFGNRSIFIAGTIALLLTAVRMFMLIDSRDATLVTISLVFAMGILYPSMYAPEVVYLPNCFRPKSDTQAYRSARTSVARSVEVSRRWSDGARFSLWWHSAGGDPPCRNFRSVACQRSCHETWRVGASFRRPSGVAQR